MNGQPTDVVTPKFAFAGMDSLVLTSIPRALTASQTELAHRMARAGPSNETRNPSPVWLDFWTSKPTELFPYSPVVDVQQGAPASSPKDAARSVDPTMSVKRMVVSTRSTSNDVRSPVRNSAISEIALGPKG